MKNAVRYKRKISYTKKNALHLLIEVKSYKMKSWEAFSSWNYVLHFFLNFFTDFFYFWYGTPNRYWDYLCEISSSYFGWFGRYLAWGGTLSGLVWRWPWFFVYSPPYRGGGQEKILGRYAEFFQNAQKNHHPPYIFQFHGFFPWFFWHPPLLCPPKIT